MKGRLRHSFEFILVIGILVVAILLLDFFKGYSVHLAIISFLSLLYVAVGVFHHWEEKNLNINQVFEHLAIGSLIFVVLSAIYLKHL